VLFREHYRCPAMMKINCFGSPARYYGPPTHYLPALVRANKTRIFGAVIILKPNLVNQIVLGPL